MELTQERPLAQRIETREKIVAFEKLLDTHPEAKHGDCFPLKHDFADEMYVRTIFLPKGSLLTGKIHKHSHPNFLMTGKVEVVTEHGGIETLTAPIAMISKAGTKRAVYAIEDSVWITVHSNTTNTQDLAEIEEEVIARNFDEYAKFIESKKLKIENRGGL